MYPSISPHYLFFLGFFWEPFFFPREFFPFISESAPLEQIVSIDCKAEGFQKAVQVSRYFSLKITTSFFFANYGAATDPYV